MNRWYQDQFTIDHYQEVSSTNDLILELACNHQIGNNHVIVAESQTKGHGRYGRKWSSPKGNLYFSLLLKPQNSRDKILENPPLLSFVAAVALSRTITDLTEEKLDLTHKWPNDILLDGKKVAGILLKSEINKNNNLIVIGIGLNIKSYPENTNFPAISLRDKIGEDIDLSPEEILKKFLNNWKIFLEKFQQFGFEPIRNLWLQKAYKLGLEITANLENQKLTGIFFDLNNSGNLILKDKNGALKNISSLEIFS